MKNIFIVIIVSLVSSICLAAEFLGLAKYPGSKTTDESSYGSMHTLTLSTTDDIEKVVSFYKVRPNIKWCKKEVEDFYQCRYVAQDLGVKGILAIERKTYGVTVIEMSFAK